MQKARKKDVDVVRAFVLIGLVFTIYPAPSAAQSSVVAQSNAGAHSKSLSPKAWGAKPPVTSRMRRHTISGIMLHHTSVRQQPRISLEKKMRGLQDFSMRPGKVGKRRKPAWGNVPYHFYIGVSGRVAEGRNLAYAGDTNTRYNTDGWIQVVLEGDFKTDHPSPAQLATLHHLIKRLKQDHNIAGERIAGHNDHASTDCPGPNLKKFLPSLR